jgi:ribonuclease G
LILSCKLIETRVALLNDSVLENHEFEYLNEKNLVGAILEGRIQNHEPDLKASFVDISEEKNVFLHYWDILPKVNDKTFEVIRKIRRRNPEICP